MLSRNLPLGGEKKAKALMIRLTQTIFACRWPIRFPLGSYLAITLLLLLAGCSSDTNNSPLVGRWQIAELDDIADRVVADADELDNANSKMTIEFESSGKLITVTSIGSINSSKVGTWKLLRYHSERGVMEIECVLQSQRTQHEIEMTSDDKIRWVPPNLAGTDNRVLFERAK